MMFAFLLLTYFTLYITGSGSSTSLELTQIFFLFTVEEHSIVYMYHNFFIHSTVSEYQSCFHVLVIVNSAAINTGVHASF